MHMHRFAVKVISSVQEPTNNKRNIPFRSGREENFPACKCSLKSTNFQHSISWLLSGHILYIGAHIVLQGSAQGERHGYRHKALARGAHSAQPYADITVSRDWMCLHAGRLCPAVCIAAQH